MENFSDVIIIGGGPCGSYSAWNLVKKSVNVTVLEEHNEIGVPCHCAGHLSINSLKNLGFYPLPGKIVENVFSGAKIYSPSGIELPLRFTAPVTCTVNRSLFDKHIAQLAEKAGAHYCLGTRAEMLITDNGYVKGVVAKRNHKTKFLGKAVLDAEGTASKILRQAGLAPPAKGKFVYGVNAEVENVKDIENDTVEVFLGRKYAPGFYAWIIPKGQGQAKVGLGTKTGNPKMLLQKFMQKHPIASRKLQEAKILKKIYHTISLGGPIPKTYSNGFITVGDAASQVKPTTGGGVIFGLNCATIAADVVSKAIKNNNTSAQFLSTYQQRFTKLLGFDMKIMLKIRRVLDKMSDEKLDEFVRLCRKLHVENTIKNLEEIDFQGKTLLNALQSPKAIASLAYLLIAYLKQQVKI